MDENVESILIYQNFYSDQAPGTNNGLIFEIITTTTEECPSCGDEMLCVCTHGITQEGRHVHVYECFECDYDELVFTLDCKVCQESHV